jgi:hypothetical protein
MIVEALLPIYVGHCDQRPEGSHVLSLRVSAALQASTPSMTFTPLFGFVADTKIPSSAFRTLRHHTSCLGVLVGIRQPNLIGSHRCGT